ncbi:HAMP domain-containing sensor histidine kinase [Dechloromonas sp. HYN0024]|uniref:sensor histidine kinase n=1 Tax=Dechloromonas sp. HYN0024 TaxID=2231055 RepID=UPI000E4443A4|nr:HAMP domain-containing sensor histidine kinase [Dechloromonas sp. HYN0024]AXS79548.1 HAMP domain-containing protein [Dechloromonas sp. HYN0024]
MQTKTRHLSHRLLRGVLLVAGGASLALGLLFLGLYRDQLLHERAEVSMQLNRMLQVTWENAMLKRDVDGLRDIVAKLGGLNGIRDVLILSPAGEVRFASDPDKLGQLMPTIAHMTTSGKPVTRFEAQVGGEVLRSINPVPNRAACTSCHGEIVANPVNGILVVDYDAAPIRESAMHSAILFMLAGTGVIALTLLTLWLMLRRHVIKPLAGLDAATRALANGDLMVRAQSANNDEIGRAAISFNSMAEQLSVQISLAEAQQQFLQTLLDGLPDGVRLIRVADKQVVLANHTFCQQVGQSAQTILKRPCYQYSYGRDEPCVPTLTVCPLMELKEVGDRLKASHYLKRPDGTVFHAEIHAVLVELDNGQGRERYIVESVRDLGQISQISHEQRLSELGLLAAGIAHEIHNPLGSVRLGVQGLVRELPAGHVTQDQIIEYMRLIDQEVDKCIAVTRRMLLLSRPPVSSLQLVVVNEALADTLMLLEFDAHAHGITQQIELPEQPLRLLTDEADIRMIFLNLIQNAHHAMDTGGALIARLLADDGDAVIEISDSGVGIPPDVLARIFDPFFSRRADGVTGTGLGLTIVKNFVERMGGTIRVDSTVGQGTLFRIRLPLAETALKRGA